MGKEAVPQRQRTVLGVLGRPQELRLLLITREMPERERQAGRKKAAGQLFQALGPTAPVQAEAIGVLTSPERAANLV